MTTINAETHLMFALQKKKLKAKKKYVSSKRTKLEKSFSDRVKEFFKNTRQLCKTVCNKDYRFMVS